MRKYFIIIWIVGIVLALSVCGFLFNRIAFCEQLEVIQVQEEEFPIQEPVSHIQEEALQTQEPESPIQKEKPRIFEEDNELYIQCFQNHHMGNSMVYRDGYYYFRSQALNYSLCRTEGAGMPVEEIADQVPGAIYVKDDQVYFLNVSDSGKLYRVNTDGSGLEKISDFSMQELIVIDDTVYFRSVYERESDPFYQLLEDDAEYDNYLCAMKLDGSDLRVLVPKLCLDLTADSGYLYYWISGDENFELYRNNLEGTKEEKIYESETNAGYTLSYGKELYWVDVWENQLIKLDREGKEEILATDVYSFTISSGKIYVFNSKEIRILDLETKKEQAVISRGLKTAEAETDFDGFYNDWSNGYWNKGIFVVNGQVLARYFENGNKGVLWHIWDEEQGKFMLFEDMEPMEPEELVLDTSNLYERNFYFPGRTDEEGENSLDGELQRQEFYGIEEDGEEYGRFTCHLPRFRSSIPGSKRINKQMEKLLEMALEDRDLFFEEVQEEKEAYPEYIVPWWREHGYDHLYVGDQYVSFHYYRTGYDGGIRDWMDSIPLIFDKKTGDMVHLEDLFTVDESRCKKRLTAAVYKYCEMTRDEPWNQGFDKNVLVNNMNDLSCYLTPDGLVLCYDRYAVAAGCYGNPTFEIPYSWMKDYLRK